MTLYKNQLPSIATPFEQFIQEMSIDLATNALFALREYEGKLPTDYTDYLVFFIDYNEKDQAIFAITKIIDDRQLIEVNAIIRKFTDTNVWEYDSYITLNII